VGRGRLRRDLVEHTHAHPDSWFRPRGPAVLRGAKLSEASDAFEAGFWSLDAPIRTGVYWVRAKGRTGQRPTLAFWNPHNPGCDPNTVWWWSVPPPPPPPPRNAKKNFIRAPAAP